MIRPGRRADRARRRRGRASPSRSAAASIPRCSRIALVQARGASSRSLRLAARRSRPAGRERRVEPALRADSRANGACRSSPCAPRSSASAATRPKPRHATRATRCSRRRWSRAKCWSPPSIATTRSETLLLQLFRGAGVAGLAAMPAIAQFGPGRIARPLLDIAARADPRIRAASRSALDRRSLQRADAPSAATSCAIA